MGDFKAPPAQSVPGVLHFIPPHLTAFEPSKPGLQSQVTNTLLWVGGLMDTSLSVAYPLTLAKSLGPEWSLMTASLTSAGHSFGISSISQDANEMSNILTYIHSLRPKGKLVIMGHSTGCQDCMEYVVGQGAETRLKVNGIILQAPVSDRQAFETVLPQPHIDQVNKVALEWSFTNKSEDVLPTALTKPIFGRAPITANRWLDLASPPPQHTGAEDMFSSDLPDDRLKKTFGRLTSDTPLLILFSGEDSAVPASVDKSKLVKHWTDITTVAGGIVDVENSGVIPGASHNLNECSSDVVSDLVLRVLKYLGRYHSAQSA